MKANLWNSLEELPTQAALLVEWRHALGEDFERARPFLRPTQIQVDSYPCLNPIPCGCRHRIVFESEETISAVCDCEEGCNEAVLRPEDLVVYALNRDLLAAALSKAFAFQAIEQPTSGEIRSALVGCWGLRRSRVFFFVPLNEKNLLDEIDRLCAASPDPFVLLLPTARFCTPIVERALRRCGAAQMSLAGLVTLVGPGHLELASGARQTIETTLGDFARRISEGTSLERAIARVEARLNALAKNQVSEEGEDRAADTARQALAIVKELESGPRIKPPSFITVFRLYCINGKSAAQIAAQCGCSKATVISRLNILERRLGVPPAKLRQYSSQFERMEDELGDWRAKEINRQELANGPLDESET